MRDMVVSYEGSTMTVPMAQLAASLVVAREDRLAMDPAWPRECLMRWIPRWQEQGWTIEEGSLTLESDEDFLMNVVRWTLSARAHRMPGAWTSVDEAVDQDTRGGYRREWER